MLEKNIIHLGEKIKNKDEESYLKLIKIIDNLIGGEKEYTLRPYSLRRDLFFRFLEIPEPLDYNKIIVYSEYLFNITKSPLAAKILGITYMLLFDDVKAMYWFKWFFKGLSPQIPSAFMSNIIAEYTSKLIDKLLKKNIEHEKQNGIGYKKDNPINFCNNKERIKYLRNLVSEEGLIIYVINSNFLSKGKKLISDEEIETLNFFVVTNKPDYKLKRYVIYLNNSSNYNETKAPSKFELKGFIEV